MISWSPGSSPASADHTSSRSSAWSSAAPKSAVRALIPVASSSNGAAACGPCSRRWHSLRATAYSHGRSRLGSRNPGSLATATTNVSWTASAASAGSLSSDRQYPYNAGA